MPPSESNTGSPERVETEAATALPTRGGGNAALFASDDFLQAWTAMGSGMFAHLDADVAATHLVSDGRSGAGAEKAVEHEVTGVGGKLQNTLNQALWLRRLKNVIRFGKKRL